MFEQVLIEQNRHWQNSAYDAGIKRTVFDKALSYMENDFIISICGVRRAGKSTLLKQIINHLTGTENIPPKSIFFLNLEDPVFNFHKDDVSVLEKIFREYMALQNPEGKVYLFLDEVQFFKDWQVFVKSKYEKKGVKIIVAGSNSRLLSAELVTILSGRTLVVDVFPFSFKEFLQANGITASNTVELLIQANRVQGLFNEYFLYGGFPQVTFEKNNDVKKDVLKNYYQNIFYNDIVPRFEIKKAPYAEKLLYFLLTNISTQASYNNLSAIVSLSDKTVKEYISYFQQSLMIFQVNRFSPSLKKQLTANKKIYTIDNGLVNAVAFKLSENYGPLLENTIAVELMRRGTPFYYYHTSSAKEVDFFIPNANQQDHKLVQVCYDLSAEKTMKREIASLKAVMQETGVNSALIITLNEEKEINDGALSIKILPAWKFLGS